MRSNFELGEKLVRWSEMGTEGWVRDKPYTQIDISS